VLVRIMTAYGLGEELLERNAEVEQYIYPNREQYVAPE
jgi:hypothetical protein